MMWLNSSSSFVDQSLVNVEFVRENLVPVKPNFSVEIDMRFVLTDTVSSILTCKVGRRTTLKEVDFYSPFRTVYSLVVVDSTSIYT